ncbi:MAG: lysophospholipase [Cyclobacteriaceae bacterium]|nr:lysophospholipase [Cyclobacteriaceae bacterium]
MKTLLAFLLLTVSGQLLAIKPDRKYDRTPAIFEIPYKEYKVKTPDLYDINVWEYSLKEKAVPGTTIILVGGDAGNISYLMWEAKALREKGIRVIAFDYRGFGTSSDFAIRADYLYHSEFAVDLDSVIKETRARYPQEKIGLLALSMGTYVSLLRKEKIDFLIADGFYHDPQAVVDRLQSIRNVTVILPASAQKIDVLQPPVPVLEFSTTGDKITITADARDFGKRNNVTVIESEGEHLMSMKVLTKDEPGDLYADRIYLFLKKNKL